MKSKHFIQNTMVYPKETHLSENKNNSASIGNTTLQAVLSYRMQETRRFKRRIVSLLFVGFLISLLVHLNIGFLLSLFASGEEGTTPSGAVTNIEFAILDSESFIELPEGNFELSDDVIAETEATSDLMDATQVSLHADDSSASLQAADSGLTPSLSGGGSAGLGAGMGGSGGAGTSFFGIASKGTRFCYIVDISGSMKRDNRLASALAELTASLKKLPDFARFYVLFYSSRVKEPAIQKGWNTARASTVRRMVKEFDLILPSGGTQPLSAFLKAFELDPLPEVIYFLTDGEIIGIDVDMLLALIPPKHRIVINTIAFGDDSSQQLLRDIAAKTGGQFNFVKTGGVK